VQAKNGEVVFLTIPDDIWSDILTKKPPEAFTYLKAESSKSPGKVKLFEVEIDTGLLSWLLPALMLLILVTLYLHVDNARQTISSRDGVNPSAVPWIGSFESKLAKFFYFGSVVLWPTGIAVCFAIQLYAKTFSFLLAFILWCGAVASGIGAFSVSQKLYYIERKSEADEMSFPASRQYQRPRWTVRNASVIPSLIILLGVIAAGARPTRRRPFWSRSPRKNIRPRFARQQRSPPPGQ
jgi:hypothetical protein